MWKKLMDLARDVLDLRRQVKTQDARLDEIAMLVRELSSTVMRLSERQLRIELEFQHMREQQTAERENFRLRLENLILRSQRQLPLSDEGEPEEKTGQ
jgi:hypothetical protein